MATGWFFFVDSALIKRDNMVDWLLWAIFGTHRDGLRDEWTDEIEGYLKNIEELFGHKIDDGRAHTVGSMKVSLDRVDTVHRPLFWYLVSRTHLHEHRDRALTCSRSLPLSIPIRSSNCVAVVLNIIPTARGRSVFLLAR